jgi:hypothetical protein
MKELVEAVSNRFRAPYFGYSALALLAFNWRGFFLLALTPGSPDQRLQAFDSVTSIGTLFFYPLLTGLLVAATADWIAYFFSRLSDKPRELSSGLRLTAEHKETVLRTRLEKARAELNEVREQELIDRAMRDHVLASLPDAPEKDVVTDQINALREVRDEEFLRSRPTVEISDFALSLLGDAGEHGLGTVVRRLENGQHVYETAVKSWEASHPDALRHIDAALDELVRAGLMRKAGRNLNTHVLTENGWEAYRALEASVP